MKRPLSEKCIVEPLVNHLRKNYDYDSTTEIILEHKLCRPSARIDVAVINGKLCGYEIKSDLDSLSRLMFQMPAYEHQFEELTLVTTELHLTNARKLIPKRWGIILAEASNNDTIWFHNLRKPKPRKRLDIKSLMFTLTVKELRLITHWTETGSASNTTKSDLVESLLSTDFETLSSHLKTCLKKRASYKRPITSS